jgi:hypothetical protein
VGNQPFIRCPRVYRMAEIKVLRHLEPTAA